jgi:hypothetical protein
MRSSGAMAAFAMVLEILAIECHMHNRRLCFHAWAIGDVRGVRFERAVVS